MTVKEFLSLQSAYPSITVDVVIKPKGTNKSYHRGSATAARMDPVLSQMKIISWFLIPKKKNLCELIIIV